MAQDQDQDRTEQATPFKLKEARKRGQVSKSLEMNSLVVLVAGLIASYLLARQVLFDLMQVCRKLLGSAHAVDFSQQGLHVMGRQLLSASGDLLWPFMLMMLVVGVLANLCQTGPVFSFFPVKPDFRRLNPVTGLKRIFSKRLIYESIKTIFKVVVFGVVLYFVLAAMLPRVLVLLHADPKNYPLHVLATGQHIGIRLLVVIGLIAAIDMVYSRRDFAKNMRMSRRELKDEVKRREGDPQIRSRRRQLQQEAAARAAALGKVPNADVIITNPTHIAVALQYERGAMSAPQVIAKGAGDLAAKIRNIARRHNVPVVENKSLARALFFQAGLDQAVPEKHFPAVAKILAWVFLSRDSVCGAQR